MNPCPCGWHGDAAHPCRCTPDQVRRYQERLSGPLLDRIDIRIEVPRQEIRLSPGRPEEASAAVAARVAQARRLQQDRQGVPNARLALADVRRWCLPDAGGVRFLEEAVVRLGLSRRACDGVLRVARTIADLAGRADVGTAQVTEALTLRRGLGERGGQSGSRLR